MRLDEPVLLPALSVPYLVDLASRVGVHLTYLLNEQIGPVHFFLDSQTQDVPTVQSQSCAQGLAEAVEENPEEGWQLIPPSNRPSCSEEEVNVQHEERMVQQGMQINA